ncbi:uncharacterized protein LOC125672723 [Ostrea edulis]|uniref:uncharacterized protein LOC125672723 n=1 Tax=Ostrea edulis TaxID=37623 RepID=UPI002094A52D|nr:uncharacterized protein LOC125672723 [Ostrea edulis]XP_056015392.1 uncharacterized protein LOC125672723 [Ostrea edulis]
MRVRAVLILVLLIAQTLPVARSQTSAIRTLLAASTLSYVASSAAGVTQLSAPELLALLLATAVILQPSSSTPICDSYPTYTYDATLQLCYRTVKEPRLSVTDADAACKADGPNAQLIQITNLSIYNFVVNQIVQNGISNMYFQGKRASSSDPFLYDDGTPVTYFNWDTGEPGSNLYLRTDTSSRLMEVSSGSSSRSYICAVYP